MKKYFSIIIAGICLSLFCSHFSALAEETTGPKMVVKEKVFNFKEVNEGQAIEHTFQVFNEGDQPLRIKKVAPG